MILCISKYSSRIFQQVISITYKLCINNCRSLHIGLKFLFRLSDSASSGFLCYCSEEDLYLLGLVYILFYLKHISSYYSDFPSISFGRVLFPSLRTVLCILPSHSVFCLLHIASAGHFQFHRLKSARHCCQKPF